MRNVSIKSVADFLAKIKKYELSECIARGECRNYKCIQSGMFRVDDPRKNSWVIQQYYNLVGNSLTELQKKHFTAFSQHYGIPTNLIDFTSSPLVALFFACQDADTFEKGYVHFIKESKLIDISDNVDFINEKNYLQLLLSFSDDTFDIVIDFVEKVRDLCLIYNDENTDFLVSSINYYIQLAIGNDTYRERSCDIDFMQLNYEVEYKELVQQLREQRHNLLNEKQCHFLERLYKKFKYDDHELIDLILYYLIIIKVVHETFDPGLIWGIKELRLPVYFVYRPPLIVSRIDNQASIFIQQQYLEFTLDSSTYIFEPAIQRIEPDKTFEITHKKEILSELDRLGINEKFIFNDYDSIAHYVKRKIYT